MSYETNDKMVSHPDHYKSGKYEVIDIIDEFCKDLTGTEAVCTANAIKYVLRWKKKNGVQDLKKAVWYLTHLIEQFAEVNADAYHMEDNTSGGGIKLNEWEKASIASQGFKKIVIHHMGCRPDEVIDISDLVPTTEGKEMFTPGVERKEPDEICGNCLFFDIDNMDIKSGSSKCTCTLGNCSNKECHVHKDACEHYEFDHNWYEKPSIDDEPEPLNLRKNAAGVYIPQDKPEHTYVVGEEFMNLPYSELVKSCAMLKRRVDECDMQREMLITRLNSKDADIDAIAEDYKSTLKTISNRLSTGSPYSKKDVRDFVDKKLEDIKNGRKDH